LIYCYIVNAFEIAKLCVNPFLDWFKLFVGVEFNLFSCIVVVTYAFGLIHSKVIDVFLVWS